MDAVSIYLGIALGISSSAMNSGSIPDPMPNEAPMKIVDSGLSGRGYIGLRYKQVALELGASKLANWQQSRDFVNLADDVTGDIVRSKSIDLRIKGFLPITDHLEVYGYLAPTYVFWHRETWAWQIPWEGSHWNITDGHNYATGFGAGFNYQLNKHWYLNADAGYVQAIGLATKSVQIGVGYKF